MTTLHVGSGINPGVLMNKTAIWAGVAIVGIITAAVTFLAAIKADTSVIMVIVGTIVVPLMGALGALGYGELKANRQATENVQRQTNGSYTQLLDMMRQQSERQDHIMRALIDIKPPLAITDTPSSIDTGIPK